MLFTAIDYETEFLTTNSDLSVTVMGNRNYANALTSTQIYMLSGYNHKIGKVAGPPSEFPWSKEMVLIAHIWVLIGLS